MVNFGDVGRICLNREISGVCENCPWWEWDPQVQQCSNCNYHVCPMYRERLFSSGARLLLGQDLQPNGQPRLSGAGSEGPLAATAKESGTS